MGDEVASVDAVVTEAPADSGSILTDAPVSAEAAQSEAGGEQTEVVADASAEAGAEGAEAAAAESETGGDVETSPESYTEFNLPEGMQADALALESAAPLFKELKLDQEGAQKLVDWYAEQTQTGSQKQLNEFDQLVGQWKTQAKSDSEYGGDKYDENVAIAQQALTKFGTPELKSELASYGLGNHPEMVRFMYRVGKALQEDQPAGGGGNVTNKKTRTEVLYPKSD